jgi:hypothetical protein
MDVGIHTKISVLVEKINYLQHSIAQNGGVVSKVDKDLLVNYVRELYELILALPVSMPQYPAPGYAAPDPNSPYTGYPTQNYPPQFSQQAPPVNPGYQPPIVPPQPPVTPPHIQDAGSKVEPGSGKSGAELNATFKFSSGRRTLSDTIKIKTAADKPSLNENYKREEADRASKMQLTAIKDLKTFISLNKRFSYINFLFGNDAGLYDEAINYLNSCDSYETALLYINTHLHPKLNWSNDNDMVTEFKTLIQRRYAP